MTRELSRPVLEVNPVAWTGNHVTKYQASVVVQVKSRNKPVGIYGDPMPTREGAIDSLIREMDAWYTALHAAEDVVKGYRNKEE